MFMQGLHEMEYMYEEKYFHTRCACKLKACKEKGNMGSMVVITFWIIVLLYGGMQNIKLWVMIGP